MPSEHAHHFGIDNIPYGIASSSKHPPSVATRLQDSVIFLGQVAQKGLFGNHLGDEISAALKKVSSSFAQSLKMLPFDRTQLIYCLADIEFACGCSQRGPQDLSVFYSGLSERP